MLFLTPSQDHLGYEARVSRSEVNRPKSRLILLAALSFVNEKMLLLVPPFHLGPAIAFHE